MIKKLMKIKPQARSVVDMDNYGFQSGEIFEDYISKHERAIDIQPLVFILEHVRNNFEWGTKELSDGWLAPRIHASLRLYRREAAELSSWEYLTLTVPEIQSYIRWRWGDKEGKIGDKKRVFGELRRHGLARLWWVSELTRNGSDYTPTVQAFERSQDLISYITDVDFSHNRAAAIAYIRFFLDKNIERKSKDAVKIGKTFNHVLTTIMLDHFAPNLIVDSNSYDIWLRQIPDEVLMIGDLPEGPNEPQVPEEQIQKVLDLFKSVVSNS